MRPATIHHLSVRVRVQRYLGGQVFDRSRPIWVDLEHLAGMNSEQLSGLGLEPMVTTSELAEYLRVDVQAIYDLRLHQRGPVRRTRRNPNHAARVPANRSNLAGERGGHRDGR